MHAHERNRPQLIAARLRHWLDIIRTPLVDTSVAPWRAKRNYLWLVRKYPELADAYGFEEGMAFNPPPKVRPDPPPAFDAPPPAPNVFPDDGGPTQEPGAGVSGDSPLVPWTPEDDVL